MTPATYLLLMVIASVHVAANSLTCAHPLLSGATTGLVVLASWRTGRRVR